MLTKSQSHLIKAIADKHSLDKETVNALSDLVILGKFHGYMDMTGKGWRVYEESLAFEFKLSADKIELSFDRQDKGSHTFILGDVRAFYGQADRKTVSIALLFKNSDMVVNITSYDVPEVDVDAFLKGYQDFKENKDMFKQGDKVKYDAGNGYIEAVVTFVNKGNYTIVNLSNGHQAQWDGSKFKMTDVLGYLEKA